MLLEYSLLCGKELAEPLSDYLLNNGAFSVSIEDADADSENENPLFGEPGLEPKEFAWNRSCLKILADDSFQINSLLENATKVFKTETLEISGKKEVPDNDWVRITQAQFSPTKVSDRLWIVPSWHQAPDANAINIRLDPGVAFGTGTHPTTRLCLEWLDQHGLTGKSVLDYGCGSGILAIAARKLGASFVAGVDIDPQAIEAADYNAKENAVDARFYLPGKLEDRLYDVVVANILSNPLRVLAPALVGRVKQGGSLVLSGILERQADELIEVYQSQCSSLRMDVWKVMEGWVCLSGKKQED